MNQTLRRVKAPKCFSLESYKYYFPENQISNVWATLEKCYGPVRRDENFSVKEIQASAFIFRALFEGNPITVIYKRRCQDNDVRRLHELLGFDHGGV